MEMDRYDNGVPSWVDLGTPDIDGAARFYGELFGWTSDEGPPEAGGYRLAMLRGKPVAGLGPQQNPGPPYWTTYVNVDDADAAAAAVSAAGGQVIVPPMDVLDAGRMAVFADTVGAFISVWQPNMHTGAQIVNEPGSFSWNELITDDTVKAAAFYTQVFGWDVVPQGGDDVATAPYNEYRLAGRSIAGMMPKPPMMPAEMPSMWTVYFAVDDADAAVAKVRELGGSVMVEPQDIPQGRFAVVADPQGAAFNVMALAADLGG